MKAKETPKPKSWRERLSDLLWRLKVTGKLWLQRHIALAALGFLGLNAVDGWLTNQAYQLAVQSGIQRSMEANPFLAPVASHWAISFKGLLGLAAIGLLAKIRKLSPQVIFWIIVFGCMVFLGVVLWNCHSLGVIP